MYAQVHLMHLTYGCCTHYWLFYINQLLLLFYTHADIRDLVDVIQELTSNQFDYTGWYQLGLHLGLYEPTLKAIEQDYKKVKDCLRECISAWLKKEDNVKETGGGPSRLSLVSALETMGKGEIANNIKIKYCNY